jgi:hypothetical protein
MIFKPLFRHFLAYRCEQYQAVIIYTPQTSMLMRRIRTMRNSISKYGLFPEVGFMISIIGLFRTKRVDIRELGSFITKIRGHEF